VTPKRIATSTIVGIWVIFVLVVVMAWQAVPALAGFTPPPPVETEHPPVGGKPPHEHPQMPVTGGQLSDPSNLGIVVVLLAGGMILLLVAISLVIRQSTRTITEKEK
jgi:hypothetical protein